MNRVLIECFLAAAAVYSFWFALKSWRESRSVDDTPTSRIRSAAQGYVSLNGHGTLPEGVENKGPLTRLNCAWWSYTIESRGRSNRSRDWSTVDSGTSTTCFFLDDGTGHCLVDPRGAEIISTEKTVWYGSTPRPEVRIPDGTTMFGKLADLLLQGEYRYTEQRIGIGARIYAVGAFQSVGGVRVTDTDNDAAELLRNWKQDQRSLLARFDNNHDGRISSDEWDIARAEARQQAERQNLTRAPDPVINVLGAPADGRPFVLSTSDAAALSRKLRWRAGGWVLGFLLALTALTLLHGSV